MTQDLEAKIRNAQISIKGHQEGVARLKADLAARERTLIWWQSRLIDLEMEKAESPASGGADGGRP